MLSRNSLDFHEKQRARRIISSPLTFIVLGIFIVVAGYNAWDMYQKSQQTKEALQKTQDAYDVLVTREQFLNERLGQLGTPAGIESEIRERFGVAKAGEEVIVVLSEEESATLSPPKKGFWARIQEWFSGADDNYVKGE